MPDWNDDQTNQNRRIHPRFDLEVEVSLSSEHNFYTGFTENISEGGVFIATYTQIPIGTMIRFEFTLPDGGAPLEAVGEVRWLRPLNPTSDITPGLGVRFVELTPEALERIKRFTSRRDSLFYEED